MSFNPQHPYDDLPPLPPRTEELERIGVLVGEKHGRETIYKHPALLEVLQK